MLNNPDKFCYICAEVTFASRKFSVTWTIKEAYLLYFGCKVGHQNNKWAPHVCYTTCSSKLNAWVNGKDVVCRLECPWFGGCLATTVLTVMSVWYTLFQIVYPWKKINQKIREGKRNDLLRKLELPKNKAELLTSSLQQWNLLQHSVKVTIFRTRKQEFGQLFKTEV